MKSLIRTTSVARGATKTAITAAGMTGIGIGAYHVKNFVSDATDNEILGIAAGIGTLLLGAVVVNGINKGVDKAFEVKNQPLLGEVANNFKFEIDDEQGVDFLG